MQQHPLGDVGLDRVGGNENVIVTCSGDFDPAFRCGGGERVVEALSAGDIRNVVLRAVGDERGDGNHGGCDTAVQWSYIRRAEAFCQRA